MKKLDNKKISIILIVTLIIVLIPYGFIIKNHIKKNKFAKNNVELYENNEESHLSLLVGMPDVPTFFGYSFYIW